MVKAITTRLPRSWSWPASVCFVGLGLTLLWLAGPLDSNFAVAQAPQSCNGTDAAPCGEGGTCCNGTCCTGECLNGTTCCTNATVCDGACCPPGQACCNGVCFDPNLQCCCDNTLEDACP
jgi:hypothetical protein